MAPDEAPSKEQLIEMVRTKVAEFNQARRDNPRLVSDLSGANLQGANLGGGNLSGINMAGANLNGADLVNANFHRTNLDGADLRGAKLGNWAGEPCMRMCLHESSFRNGRYDRAQLEEMLRVMNLNADWEIKYEIVPKNK